MVDAYDGKIYSKIYNRIPTEDDGKIGEVQFCIAEECKIDKDGFLKVKVSIPLWKFGNNGSGESTYSNLTQGWVKGRWVINRKCIRTNSFSTKYYTVTNKNNGLCITINIAENGKDNKAIAFRIVNTVYEWENLPENKKFPSFSYFDLLRKLQNILSEENRKYIESNIAA